MEAYISSSGETSVFWLVGTLIAIYISHRIYRWRNPKMSTALPPGSMGLPFIGETIQLVLPSASLDLPPFIKNRLKRYGPIFRTSVAGRPVIVTADPEFNHFLLRQDGVLVESWSLDTFAQVFDQATESSYKYQRKVTLHQFGVEALKGKLLPQIEVMVQKTLSNWSSKESVEVRSETIAMTIDFALRQMFSGDLEDASLKISDMFKSLLQGLISFPINLPGTTHHKCLQIRNRVTEMIREVVRKRLEECGDKRGSGDMLDHIIEEKKSESFLTEDFIVKMIFGLLFAASDSLSNTMALAFKLLAEHPLVLEELTAEHEAILKKRANPDSTLTWNEYKSMTFYTSGYTIPAGWTIVIVSAALHLNDNQFEDPLKFNPWRWKVKIVVLKMFWTFIEFGKEVVFTLFTAQEIDPSILVKCFMPFGSGMRQCAGAEYSRVFLATFLHILVTKYR
ncbi:UNVERIFIED_CONTAM: cytochrome [Sesamum latifolium]|uniref:Cytochrome n=1 Tax=Sesamum latifolium TaxID=2727402 RepID=A0AAW2TA57_9LAMI